MTGFAWVAATVFVAVLALVGLLLVTMFVALLVGVFAKGYDNSREAEIHSRGKKP